MSVWVFVLQCAKTHLRTGHHWVPEVTHHHPGVIDCLVFTFRLRESLKGRRRMKG